MSQERNIVITNKALYNFKNKSLKRRIDLKVIQGMTVSKTTEELVIHCINDEHDYHYVSSRVNKIVETINKSYKILIVKDLLLFQIDQKDISNVVTQKKEKSSNQAFTKMPKTGNIAINMYLYGKVNSPKGAEKKTLETPNSPPLSKEVEIENPKLKWNNKSTRLEDFQILKVLGRGSFGKVCLVQHSTTGAIYAMKALKKDVLLNQEQVENTLQEKVILSSVKHPFLVSLDFCFQTVDRIYFIMCFMRGGELFELLRKFRIFDEEK